MAIAGSDFVCKNDGCQYKGCGVALTSPWPLGDIDKVIASKKVSNNPQLKKDLIQLKEQGRKYACISLPDSEGIPVVGYRVHMWCEKCPCDWQYDAMIPENSDGNAIQSAIKNTDIPENCPTCNSKLKTFAELIDENSEGIRCTSCHSRLVKSVWFCNETGSSEKLNPLIKLPNKE